MNLPKSRPQKSKDSTERLLRSAGVDPAVNPCALMGVRGYYLDTMGKKGANDVGIYDDAIFFVSPNAYLSVNANTDPSVLKQNVSTLKPGLYLYRKGKHGLSKPGGGYPAFRPATKDEELPTSRFNAKTGKYFDSTGVAINIHKGGYNTTSSLGCQTVYPDQWLSFQTLAYSEMDRYGQKTIPYLLIS